MHDLNPKQDEPPATGNTAYLVNVPLTKTSCTLWWRPSELEHDGAALIKRYSTIRSLKSQVSVKPTAGREESEIIL